MASPPQAESASVTGSNPDRQTCRCKSLFLAKTRSAFLWRQLLANWDSHQGRRYRLWHPDKRESGQDVVMMPASALAKYRADSDWPRVDSSIRQRVILIRATWLPTLGRRQR